MKFSTYQLTIVFIISINLIFSCTSPVRTANITNEYEVNKLYWLFSDLKEEKPRLPFELAPDDMPMELRYKLIDQEQEAVLRAVTFLYPEGTPSGKHIKSIEIWTASISESKGWRLAFKGELPENDTAPRAEVPPTVTRWIIIRFFTSWGNGPATLPAAYLEGDSTPPVHHPDESGDFTERPYIFFIDDSPMGEFYLSRTTGKDNGFNYIYDYNYNLITIFPFGSGKYEINMNCTAKLETDSELAGRKFHQSCPDMKVSIEGRRTNNGFTLNPSGIPNQGYESDGSGGVRKHIYETTNAEEEQFFDVALHDKLIAEGLAVGIERNYPTVMPFEGRFLDIKANVLEYFPARHGRSELYAVWVHDDNNKFINHVDLIQPDGKLIRSFDYTNGVETWLVDNPDDWEINPYVIDFEKQLEDAKQGIRQIVAQPDFTTRARIKIRWNEVPPERMNLNGPRQKVISVTELEHGVYEAELETIRLYPGDPPIIEQQKLSATDLQAYLLSDDVVQPDSKKIKKLAEEIAGTEKDRLEIAIKIFNWLIRKIEPENKESFYVPPAGEMLNNREGDCKYFAVLFASLARSKGIPTRFVFGQRYIGGRFGYHVWNQIYIDDTWIDVDASDLNFFPGALRVQLDTGTAFNEKGHIGAILGFRPDPEVNILQTGTADFQVVDSSRNTIYSDSFYQDAFLGFRLKYPPKMTHNVYDLGFMRKISFTIPNQKNLVANVYVMARPIKSFSKNASPEQITEYILRELSGMMIESILVMDLAGAISKITPAKAGETLIAGQKSIFLTGSFMDRHGEFYHFDMNFTGLRNCLVLFYFAAPSDIYYKYSDDFDFIKKSFDGF